MLAGGRLRPYLEGMRSGNDDDALSGADGLNGGEGGCWLCGRVLGERVEWHHPVPKQKGGRAVVALHSICHRTVHAHFTNGELARIGADRGLLLASPAIAKFVQWVASKPPDFHAPTRKGPTRKGR